MPPHGHPKLNLLEGVIALDHSVFNHLHEDVRIGDVLESFSRFPASPQQVY